MAVYQRPLGSEYRLNPYTGIYELKNPTSTATKAAPVAVADYGVSDYDAGSSAPQMSITDRLNQRKTASNARQSATLDNKLAKEQLKTAKQTNAPTSSSGSVIVSGAGNAAALNAVNAYSQNLYGEADDLISEEKAARDTANQAVTSRLDAEARNKSNQYAARSRAGLYAGDGGVNRTVSVSPKMNDLHELNTANYLARKRESIGKRQDAANANVKIVTDAIAKNNQSMNDFFDRVSKSKNVRVTRSTY